MNFYIFIKSKKIILKKTKNFYFLVFLIIFNLFKLFNLNVFYNIWGIKYNKNYINTLIQYNLYLTYQYRNDILYIKNYKYFHQYNYIHTFWNINNSLKNNYYLFNNIKDNKKKKLIFNNTNKNIKSNYIYLNNGISINYSKKNYFFWINILEKRKIFICLNLLFFNNNSNFIFSELNINTISVYLSEYNLYKYLLNKISIKKWNNYFKNNYINNYWYFNKLNLVKLNIISINFLNNNSKKFLKNYFSIYQIKSSQWILITILKKNLNNIFYTNNLYLNINKYNVLKNININLIKKTFFYPNLPIKKKYFLNELIVTIIILIFYKDPSIFLQFIKNNLQSIIFKKQGSYINFIKNLLNFLFKRYGKLGNFLGYKLIIKGKLNKLGNVRKKKIIIYGGKNSLSNINLHSDFINDVVLTTTGVIGITIIINYI